MKPLKAEPTGCSNSSITIEISAVNKNLSLRGRKKLV